MKNAFFSAFLLSFLLGHTQEKNTTDYNKWSVELSAGQNKAVRPFAVGYYSSDPTKYFNFSGVTHYDIGVRYMLSNAFGLKLDYGMDQFSEQSGAGSLSFDTKLNRFGFQGVMNLGRLLRFESFSNRLGLLTHAGVHVSQLSVNEGANKNITEDNGGVMFGITPQVRLTKWLALTADFTVINNLRQHLNWDGSAAISDDNLSGMMYNTSLGLTFYLGKKEKHADWYSEKDVAINPVEKYDDKELKKRIEDLEQKILDFDKDRVPDYLDLKNDTGLKVDSKLRFSDENNKGIPDKKEENLEYIKPFNPSEDAEYNAIIEFKYNIMYYDFSRVDPNKESRQKLKFVIDYLQKHPEYKVQLIGYTENIGNVKSNHLLSDRRVAKLKNILQSFNVSGDRITIDVKGIDTTYSPSNNGTPLARRVKIVIVK